MQGTTSPLNLRVASKRANYLFPEGCCCKALKPGFSCHHCDYYNSTLEALTRGEKLPKLDSQTDAIVGQIL